MWIPLLLTWLIPQYQLNLKRASAPLYPFHIVYLLGGKIISSFAAKDTSVKTKTSNLSKRTICYIKSNRLNQLFSIETHPKWRANATTALLSFHKSEIGIAFPFKSNTFAVSSKLLVSSLTAEVSIPVHIRTFKILHQLQTTIQNYVWLPRKWRRLKKEKSKFSRLFR